MKDITEKVIEYQPEIIKRIQELIQIKSIENTPKEGKPFGEGVDGALKFMLKLSEELGFRTKNGFGYYGFAEMGEGEEIVGILGHLDVVPEGDHTTWTYPPYGGCTENGRIYGRGAVDDKGPIMGALYAMKIVKDLGLPIGKRVRIIFGTNEETRWEDMAKYKQEEEIPVCGFTPDSDYPLIFAEKGLLQFQLVCNKGSSILLTGGTAYNSVPDKCSYDFQNNHVLLNSLDKYGYQYNVDEETLTVLGKASHSAKAWRGTNAVVRLCMALNDSGIQNEAIRFIAEILGEDCYATGVIGQCEDVPSGKMTFNVAKIDFNDEQQVIGVDIRFPVTKKKEEIVAAIQKSVSKYNLDYREIDYIAPLYVSNLHPLVQMLRRIYEEETGLDSTPISTGGATYARAFENFVAFGPLFPGKEKMAHQKDEYIEINDLMKSVEMYVKAIAEMAK